MAQETLVVSRAPFDIEEPWSAPAAARTVRLRRATDGTTPRLATSVAIWYDNECLSILYSFADDHIVARHFAHDAALYDEDVVEAFLSPETASEYFELEVSPRGTIFDARISSPDGVRQSMHVDRDWTCEGLMATIRAVTELDRGMSLDVLLRVPFSSLGRSVPAAGETWRANFFRIDRHPEKGDEFSAWQPTLREPADFHVTAAFGTLSFQ
jgi:Carbohydrate-binding family 9